MSDQISMDTFLHVAFIKADDAYYVMLDDDTTVCAALHIDTAKGWFEDAYRSNHVRGYESAMSATINWLQFQPSIVRTTGDVLQELIGFPTQSLRLRSVSGSMTVFKFADQNGAQELFDAGEKPALIKDEWL